MSEACYCDFDPAEAYVRTTPVARKDHKCYECGCVIEKGEQYERVFAKWDGSIGTFKTCPDCIGIRDALSEMSCFCWAHGNLLDDVAEQFQNAYFPPALKFNYLRIFAKHRRIKRKK